MRLPSFLSFSTNTGSSPKEEEIYQQYVSGAASLNASGGDFNACRCSHQLLQTLQSAHRGDFGPDFSGCLRDEASLRAFAKYMASRV